MGHKQYSTNAKIHLSHYKHVTTYIDGCHKYHCACSNKYILTGNLKYLFQNF